MASTQTSSAAGITLDALVDAVRRRWAVVLVCGLLGVIISGIYAFTRPPRYTAEATLLPNLEDGAGVGLLGQFDFLRSLTRSGAPREDFYEHILVSETMLDLVLARTWTAAGDTIALSSLLGIATDQPPTDRQAERLKRKLRTDVIRFSKDQLTSFMTLKVELPRYPGLAADLCNFLLDRLEEFNQKFHQEQSRQQREFLAERLARVAAELEQAEARMSEFVAENRNYAASPQLMSEYNRLSREVQAYGQTWLELRSQYELARIEENRDLSSLSILDRARPPVFRSRPHRTPMMIAGGLLGGLGGVALAWWRDRRLQPAR